MTSETSRVRKCAMPVSPARRIAFDILRRVEAGKAYAAELLRARLDGNVPARDAALATELVLGVLRWQKLLDFLIQRYAGKPPRALDQEVLLALRLGLYQLRQLTRIPARAAVNESVELVKQTRKRSAATLVNAVLRRAAVSAREPAETLLPAGLPQAERMAILHSHPTWIVERWLENFGERKTAELLQANNQTPALACVVPQPEFYKKACEALEAAGLRVRPGRMLRWAIQTEGGSPARTEAFRRGWIGIQDEASQAIPFLLGVKAGHCVLDLCAAPGGKTMALARDAGPGGLVVAADLHEHRLRAMRARLDQAGTKNVAFIALDGTRPLPFRERFPRILADVPCSGTGTLARNPEIRWRLRPEDLADLHRRQVALLTSALAYLAPHGRLVYSTCSLEPEENEQVIAEVLALHPRMRVVPAEIPAEALTTGMDRETLVDSSGAFRTWPPQHHSDGFFAVAMEKK